jgi:hypothetical protein
VYSHIFVGVKDFHRALAFYRALMTVLGVQERFCDEKRPWAGWQSHPEPRPLFLIGTPYNERPHEGNKLCEPVTRRHASLWEKGRMTKMLELRPNCECCDKDLPPQSTEAMICTFECTFCVSCAEGVLQGKCPNCGGELVRRPRRPENKLAKYPASTVRVLKPSGCKAAAP